SQQLGFEVKCPAAAHDMARRRAREMRAQNLHGLIAEALDEFLARITAHFRIRIELADPVRMGNLYRMVNQIAGDYRVLAARGDPPVDMAGGGPGGGPKIALASDPAFRLEKL